MLFTGLTAMRAGNRYGKNNFDEFSQGTGRFSSNRIAFPANFSATAKPSAVPPEGSS
jgi:hypothetical protein